MADIEELAFTIRDVETLNFTIVEEDITLGSSIAEKGEKGDAGEAMTDEERAKLAAAYTHSQTSHEYDPLGTAEGSMQAHLSYADPHPQYAAAITVEAHFVATDPHPQYALDTDLSGHVSGVDPHPQYFTIVAFNNHLNNPNPHPQYLQAGDLEAHATDPGAHSQYASDVDLAAHANNLSLHITDADRLKIYNLPTDFVKTVNGQLPDAAGNITLTIPAGLSLGETSDTAFRGDHGKAAYDHSQSPHSYDSSGTAATILEDHETASDPHPQYAVPADIDSSIAEHTGAVNPHPNYVHVAHLSPWGSSQHPQFANVITYNFPGDLVVRNGTLGRPLMLEYATVSKIMVLFGTHPTTGPCVLRLRKSVTEILLINCPQHVDVVVIEGNDLPPLTFTGGRDILFVDIVSAGGAKDLTMCIRL